MPTTSRMSKCTEPELKLVSEFQTSSVQKLILSGDGIEMRSVTDAFAPRNRQRRQDQPLYLGAVKANIGHGMFLSGF